MSIWVSRDLRNIVDILNMSTVDASENFWTIMIHCNNNQNQPNKTSIKMNQNQNALQLFYLISYNTIQFQYHMLSFVW